MAATFAGTLSPLMSSPAAPSSITACLHVDDSLLLGTAEGSLLLLDAASGALLARTRADHGTITHLACDAACTFVFALQGGAVYHAACPLSHASHLDGDGVGGADVASIDLQPPLPDCSAVSCFAPFWSRRSGTRLCCASLGEHSLYVFGFRQRPPESPSDDDVGSSASPARLSCELQVVVPLELPAGFGVIETLAWAVDDSVLLCDGSGFAVVPPLPPPPPPAPAGGGGGGGLDSRRVAPVPALLVRALQGWLEAPSERSSDGRRARALALPTGETLVLGARR